MNFRRNLPDEVELNITPLIDVVFLLLIFFMVSTSFDHKSEMNITLPDASREVAKPAPDTITVSIDADAHVYVNREALADGQLSTIKEKLYDLSADLDDPPIVINADKAAPYQMVIRTMDAARQLGLVRIRFATNISEADY